MKKKIKEINKRNNKINGNIIEKEESDDCYFVFESSEEILNKNEKPTSVIIKSIAYRDLVIYGMRYAATWIEREEQREVYGILVGRVNREERKVIVNQAIGIVFGERTGVEFENKQYVDLSQIDEKIWKQSSTYNNGDFIIGWWHTHPGFGFFYSQTDTLNHIGFQTANPYAIGIVFDYTKLNIDLKDPGIEIFTLESIEKAEYSDTISINFQIQNLSNVLLFFKNNLEELVKKINDVSEKIKIFNQMIIKKKFAQLQRNYGLLLIPKQKKQSKKQKEELSEEELFMYEWNEANIKQSYKIPKFRQKIEKLIKKYNQFEKIKQNKIKRIKGQEEILVYLNRAKERFSIIANEFDSLVKEIRKYRRWFGSEERLILQNFYNRLNQYAKILNALLTKTYFILPENLELDEYLFDPQDLENIYYGEERDLIDLEIQMKNTNDVNEKKENNQKIIKNIKNIKTTKNIKSLKSTKTNKILISDPELNDIKTSSNPKQNIHKNEKKSNNSNEIIINNVNPLKIGIKIKPVKITTKKKDFEITLDEIFEE